MTWFRSRRRKRLATLSRPRLVGIFSACVAAAVAGSAAAQNVGRTMSKFYPDSSEAAETLLRNAAGHAKSGQWSEAIGIYQRVVEQYGDKVARLPRDPAEGGDGDEFALYVDLRAYCQRTLAGLPEEARAVYRRRVDAQAERWFREGQAGRDPAPLRRVVERAVGARDQNAERDAGRSAENYAAVHLPFRNRQSEKNPAVDEICPAITRNGGPP